MHILENTHLQTCTSSRESKHDMQQALYQKMSQNRTRDRRRDPRREYSMMTTGPRPACMMMTTDSERGCLMMTIRPATGIHNDDNWTRDRKGNSQLLLKTSNENFFCGLISLRLDGLNRGIGNAGFGKVTMVRQKGFSGLCGVVLYSTFRFANCLCGSVC